MTALYLIQEIEKAGGKIQTENGKLKIKAPVGIVSDTLKKQLVKHKTEIIDLLQVKCIRCIRGTVDEEGLVWCLNVLSDSHQFFNQWQRVNSLFECTYQKQNWAQGYGCAACGNKIYQQVFNGWECEKCKAIYEIIGGSKGPVLIQ
jgi:hypothetical protein